MAKIPIHIPQIGEDSLWFDPVTAKFYQQTTEQPTPDGFEEIEMGGGVPEGGTTGQIIVKTSSVDGDVEWQDPGTAVLDDNAVTMVKLADLATDRLIGRATAGTGDPEAITCTAAGRALLDDANAEAQLTTLGAAAASHTHAVADLTDAGDIVTHNITEFAAASHAHAGTDITSGSVALARGGLGGDLSAIVKGGLIVGTASGTVGIKAVGSNDQLLLADSTAAGGVKWGAITQNVTGPASTTQNKVPQWGATTNVLADGLALETTLSDPGNDSTIPTSKAIRTAISVAGGGDLSSDTSTSVDGEIVLFKETLGKTVKRGNSLTGIAALTSGVVSTVTAPSSALVGLTDTQTLQGKTIDTGAAAPNVIKINGNTLEATAGIATLTVPNATQTLLGGINTVTAITNKSFSDTTTTFELATGATSKFRFDAQDITAGQTRVYRMPNSDQYLVGRTSTETLTNKTIDTAAAAGNVLKLNGNTLAATAGTATVTVPNSTDTLVGRDTTDTLTNKSLTSPTITTPTISGTGFTNAQHAHAGATSGGQLDGTACFSNTPTAKHVFVGNSGGTAFEKRQLAVADLSDVSVVTGSQFDMLVKGSATWENKSPAEVRTNLTIGTDPASPTDNTIPKYIGGQAGNKEASGVTIDDSNNVAVPGHVIVGGGASASVVRFLEPSGSGTNYSEFKAQAQSGNVTYTLPAADGLDGQVLKTNGLGTLSWGSTTGLGDTFSPASHGDNILPRFDGTDSKTLQTTGISISDADVVTGATFASGGNKVNNPAGTFAYTIKGGTIGANYDLTLPLIAGNATLLASNADNTMTSVSLTANSNQIVLDSDDGSGYTTTITDSATAARVLTLPDATDTLVGKATTDTLTNKTLTAPKIANGGYLADANGNEQIKFVTTASAENELTVTNGASGSGVTIATTGTNDSDIDLLLVAKGAGVVKADGNRVMSLGAAEISTLGAKATTALDDVLVFEDSEASYAKKKITLEAFFARPPLFDVNDTILRITGNGTTRGDATFSTVGVTVGQTRTFTFPNHDGTLFTNGAGEIAALTAKATPHANDLLVVDDSEATNAKKKVTITSLASVLSPLAGSSSLTTVGTVSSGNVDAAVSAASESAAGKVEFADATEINAGSSGSLAVSPDRLAGSYAGTKAAEIQIVADGTDWGTTDVAYFRVPPSWDGMNLVYANADATTAGSDGSANTVQIRNMTQFSSNDALSTAVSIAADGTLGTAGTVAGDYDALATSDLLRITATKGSTTAPKGLRVWFEARLP